MLKDYWKFFSRIVRVADNALVILAFFLSYYFRDQILGLELPGLNKLSLWPELAELAKSQPLGSIEQYYVVLGLSLPLFNALLEMFGAYRSMRIKSFWQIVRSLVFVPLIVFFLLGSLLYLLKLDLSRSFLALFCSFSAVALIIERLVCLRLLRFYRARGRNFRHVLIVGTGEQARRIYEDIPKDPELGLRVIGFVELGYKGLEEDWARVSNLSNTLILRPSEFESALKKYAIDEVLFTDVLEFYSTVKEMAQVAVEEGVRVSMVADLFSLEIFKSEVSYLGSLPLLNYHPSIGASESGAHVVKRLIDLALSSVLLIVLSPLMCFVALALKLSEPKAPVFFKQQRVGLNGRLFTLLKFRSMVPNAEELQADLVSQNEMQGPVFKIEKDPRVTKIGRWIRKYSIDELPQLFNVLKGDMSIVGPRPPLPHEVSQYLRRQRKRLSMRPGLTCTWQVSGRNKILDFDQWAELDLEYIENWSLKKDLKLILQTVPAVFSGNGAR